MSASRAAASGLPGLVPLGRFLLVAAIAATVLPNGALEEVPFAFALALNALALAVSAAVPIRNPALARLHGGCLLLAAALGAYVLAQAAYFPGNPLAHPIWGTAAEHLGTRGGAISIAPAASLAALPALLLPFVVFASAIALHQDDESAFALWRRLAALGAGVAAFGLLQHAFFPRLLLLEEKEHYLDSLTAVFVNRNSIATFFGIAALLLVGLAAKAWRELDPRKVLPRLLELRFARGDKYTRFHLLGAAFLTVLVALVLTKSRGGTVSTFIVLAPLAAWLAHRLAPPGTSLLRRLGLALAVSAAGVGGLSLLASRVALRIERQGVEDARWCAWRSSLEAVADHPWLGTGLGTFRQIFPLYRDPECGIAGVWVRAHNTYLEGYLTLGLPFAAALLLVLFVLVRVLLAGLRERRHHGFAPAVGLAILSLVLLHAFVDFSIQIPGVAAYFAAALAGAASISMGRRGRVEPRGTGLREPQ